MVVVIDAVEAVVVVGLDGHVRSGGRQGRRRGRGRGASRPTFPARREGMGLEDIIILSTTNIDVAAKNRNLPFSLLHYIQLYCSQIKAKTAPHQLGKLSAEKVLSKNKEKAIIFTQKKAISAAPTVVPAQPFFHRGRCCLCLHDDVISYFAENRHAHQSQRRSSHSSIFNNIVACPGRLTLGGRLIVLASMILEAWKFDRDPIENQLEFDLWLTLERADVTDRPDSELMDDKAENDMKAFSKS